jgi:hypothetical protein
MTTHPSTVNAKPRLAARLVARSAARSATKSATMSADQIFKTGVIMCIIWLSAATMLISQAQKTELVGNRFAAKQVFVVPGS